ncbi:PAS domain-containing sensor histidine kinase [Nocardia aurea]|uniref:PAS domain-containing sensor histidine kinase n=1 Tax=Nocardia aurea TaxID=2144174 RepID=UPI000D686F94|nr:GAF domain-containing sensor histidine kinase [Nocardia aurea]
MNHPGTSLLEEAIRSERDAGRLAPYGLAVIKSEGTFSWVNAAGARLLGRAVDLLVGTPSPFPASETSSASDTGLFEYDSERIAAWEDSQGRLRDLAFRVHSLTKGEGVVAAFRDVTDERHRQRRVAAIARSAAKLASQGSLAATLDALAEEVLQTDAVAAVQILTIDPGSQTLRIMGSAGFGHWPDFFDRLVECQERGASLVMIEALHGAEPIVVSDRWSAIRTDPAWEPLHQYLGELRWESFASVPLIIRGRVGGVLNVFFSPGQTVAGTTLDFLVAMADQAAVAVDYVALLQRERDVVRREERQRLARDLHDSIVQQVFSISMQAKSLEILGQRNSSVAAAPVRRIADEVGLLSQTVLADLRAMVHELRPVSATELGGLEEAVRALVDSTTNRTGMRFSIVAGQGLDSIDSSMADDAYRIVAEAVHNVVKHADASKVVIRLAVRKAMLRGTVTDDGCGLPPDAGKGSGYGLQTMRERAEQWGGNLTVGAGRSTGTVVKFTLPITGQAPTANRRRMS